MSCSMQRRCSFTVKAERVGSMSANHRSSCSATLVRSGHLERCESGRIGLTANELTS